MSGYCPRHDRNFIVSCAACTADPLPAGMNPGQEAHLYHIKQTFFRLVDAKYRKGQAEHGGNLYDVPTLKMVEMAIEEAIDQFSYLLTIRDNLLKADEMRREWEKINAPPYNPPPVAHLWDAVPYMTGGTAYNATGNAHDIGTEEPVGIQSELSKLETQTLANTARLQREGNEEPVDISKRKDPPRKYNCHCVRNVRDRLRPGDGLIRHKFLDDGNSVCDKNCEACDGTGIYRAPLDRKR